MRIARARAEGLPSEQRSATFTGVVWADPILGGEAGVTVANVLFEPAARTHWHTHEVGQVLYVLAGEGWVQSRDETGGRISVGDSVHIPADEEHWHGAAPDTLMLHLAISIGATSWLEPVSDRDYELALATKRPR